MPYARSSDGTMIGYDVAGTGEPLVLLAGQANARTWWDPIRAGLATSHRTIALDAAGTGTSEDPRDGTYSTRRFATDVVAVLDALAITRAHVYGTSMGGKVAQWLATDHPHRLGALALGCTSTGGPHALVATPDVLRTLAVPPAEPRTPPDAANAALLDLMFTPAYVRAHGGPYHVLGDPSMSQAARRGHRRASASHDAWAALPAITAPTLVLHGTADLFSPPGNAERLAARIPGAEVLLIEGARHAYFEEFEAEATPAVLDFLGDHPLGR